jgi:hypothetical protein
MTTQQPRPERVLSTEETRQLLAPSANSGYVMRNGKVPMICNSDDLQ